MKISHIIIVVVAIIRESLLQHEDGEVFSLCLHFAGEQNFIKIFFQHCNQSSPFSHPTQLPMVF